MGANVSTTVDRAATTIENVSRSACTMSQAVNQNISNIDLDFTDTRCPNLRFENRVKMVGTCDMDAMAEALAQASTALTKEQTAALGIGINVETSVRDRATNIRRELEQNCNSEQQANQTIQGIKIRAKNFQCDQLQFLNDADVTTQCVMATVTKALTSDEFELASKQKVDWLSSFGRIWIIIAILIGVAAVARLLLARQEQAPTTATPDEAVAALAQLRRQRRRRF